MSGHVALGRVAPWRCRVGFAAFLLIGLAAGQDSKAMSASAPQPGSLSVTCDGADPETDRICALFRQVLATRYPKRVLQAAGMPGGGWIGLQVIAVTPSLLTVRLTHQLPGNDLIPGPERSYDVIDRIADDRLYTSFLAQLLEESALPF